MTITIRLKTDNAAFEDDRGAEVARIVLEAVVPMLEHGELGKSLLYDANGNTVGSVTVTGK